MAKYIIAVSSYESMPNFTKLLSKRGIPFETCARDGLSILLNTQYDELFSNLVKKCGIHITEITYI